MTDPIIERFAYNPENTQGRLYLPNKVIWTLERPWVPHMYPGGSPNISCIPDGEYFVEHFTRPNGDKVLRLFNPALGVYRRASERPKGKGRFLILLHPANFVEQVEGCIAPGTHRKIEHNHRAVKNSRVAMSAIMDFWNKTKFNRLTIRPVGGTVTRGAF